MKIVKGVSYFCGLTQLAISFLLVLHIASLHQNPANQVANYGYEDISPTSGGIFQISVIGYNGPKDDCSTHSTWD